TRATCPGLLRQRQSWRAAPRARTRASCAGSPSHHGALFRCGKLSISHRTSTGVRVSRVEWFTKARRTNVSIEALRDVVAHLSASASALAALGAELDARVSGKALHPMLREHVDNLLREAGAFQALDGTSAAEAAPLLAEIRHFWALDNDFLETPERAPGWTYTDTSVLQGGGEVTEGFANVLPRFLPLLDGLASSLEGSNAAFLDVGTGVARLAIGMARKWPSLAIVGLDVWGPALTLARKNVAEAGLQARIQLREQ